MSIEDQLREAIRSCGLSGNSLAKEAGVSQSAISRFMTGEDIRFSAAAKLAAYFELELQPRTHSYAHLAKLFNISEASIRVAEKVKADGIPELADAVWKGHLELSEAEKIASKPRDKQLGLLSKAKKKK